MARLMAARFPTKCGICRTAIPEGTQAYYDKFAAKGHRMTCVACYSKAPEAPPASRQPPLAGTVIREHWDSAAAFYDACRPASCPQVWEAGHHDSRHKGRDGFFGSDSYEKCLRLTQEGWPEGAAKMDKALQAAPLAVTVRAPTQVYDVAGAFPCVPAAVAGDPLNMVAAGEESTRRKPVLRWLVSVSISVMVEPYQIIHRGTAILSALDAYESAGYSVQLDVGCTLEGEPYSLDEIIPLKSAGQHLDIDRAAFLLMHPDVLRRLIFARIETWAELKCFGSGYGSIRECPQAGEYDAYFGAMRPGNAPSTPQEAAAAVAAVLEHGMAKAA